MRSRFAVCTFFAGHAWWLKSVPQPRLGQNVMRMRGIFLNFLAQLVYHDAEILRLLGVIGSPDNLQQSPMGERFSLLNDQRAQDVEFFWTQVDSVTADIDDSLLKINAQFWSLDFGEGLIGGGPSHCRPDACQQFTDGEGFYDIVIRPRNRARESCPAPSFGR